VAVCAASLLVASTMGLAAGDAVANSVTFNDQQVWGGSVNKSGVAYTNATPQGNLIASDTELNIPGATQEAGDPAGSIGEYIKQSILMGNGASFATVGGKYGIYDRFERVVAIGSKAAVAQPGDVFDVTVLGASAIAGSYDHRFNNGTQLPGAWTDTNSLRGATAIGGSAKALSSRATALGYQSEARGIGTIAIGSGAIAGVSATNNTGTGDVANAIAIGNASNASAASSVAIGREAQAIGESTVAIGSIAGKNALGAKSVLIGYESGLDSASGNSVYIGDGAGRGQKADPRGNIGSSSLPGHNVGIGHWTLYNSTGEGNTALGLRAGREQKGSDNTHIGAFAGHLQDGDYNVNAGYFAGQKSKGEKNLNLGIEAGASHTGSSSVSLGDSANKGTTSERSVAIGRSSASTGNDSIALGSQAIAGNAVWDSVGGKYSASTALNDIAIGTASKAAGGNSIALGTSATVSGAKSIAIGYGNEVKGAGSGAIGVPSRIDGNASYAMGNDNVVGTGSNNVFILGNNVNIGATDVKRDVDTGIVTSYTPTANPVSGAVALGNNTGVTVAGGVALGEGSQATIGANVAGYDPKTGSASADTSPTWKATNAAVSVGKADGTLTRQITGVAAGTVATDAVNVAQLKAAASASKTKVTEGSNIVVSSTTGADGSETYTVKTAQDLAVNTVTTGNITISSDGLTINGGPSVTTTGINAGGNKITNVAAGTNSTDAVNFAQLQAVVAGSASKSVVAAGTNVASVTKTAGAAGQDIYTVNADATSVEAGSTAVTVTPGAKDASNVTKYNVDLSAQTKKDIADGAEAADVVAKKGLTFAGDNSSTSDAIKLGETLAITGDSNITTEAAGTGLQVKLNTELKDLTSVTTTDTAGNKTVTNGSGITITPAVGNAVSLTTAGLNNGGNTITNVGSAGTLNATNSNAATGADVYNAIHGTDGLLDTATFGLKAQDNSTVTKKLNNTVSVVGGHTGAGTTSAKNIKTVINATGELEIQMAETPEFASVTVGATGAQTQLSSTGANQLQIGSTGAKPITVDAATGVITGLSNTTWNGTATTGRAATEDQLQAVHDAAKATADAAVQYDAQAGGVVNKDSVTLAGTTGTAVTPNADGTFTSMSGGTALNNVASAGDISDVNNAYKAVNAGDLNNQVAGLTSKGLKFTANNGTVHTAALGSTISVKGAAANTDADKFDAGKNIMTSVDASGNILVAMAKDLKADSVSTGATTINNDGLTITGGPSVTTTGINAGSKAITNVADGTVAADSKDAVTGGQLYGTADSVKTILGGNAALGADGKLTMSNIGGTGKGTIDEAVKAAYDKAGEAADAAKKHTTVVAGQNVTVTEGTNADGGKEYTVAVKDDIELTSVTTGATKMDTTGVTIKNADPAKTVSLTADGLNNGGNKITNVADGAVAANSKDAVTGGQLYSTNTQVAGNTAALGGGAKFDSASNTFTAPVYNVTDANGNAKVVNDVGSAIEALNQGFKVTSAATGSGTVSGTATTAVKSGSTMTYVAGDNIALTQDGMKFTIATNKNVNFDKVTVGDVVLDKDNGIDAGNKQITNVGDGVNPGDAVNKKQLEAAINGNKEGLNALQQQIGQVSADANAGAASAMATAGLPQAYTPGKSMIAAAGSVYKGATAQAIGISTITENGKWVFKGSVNVNNRGYAGATVGVGYQW
jgi:autotransporter adhesin